MFVGVQERPAKNAGVKWPAGARRPFSHEGWPLGNRQLFPEKSAQELLAEFEKLSSGATQPEAAGFFTKVKDFFGNRTTTQ